MKLFTMGFTKKSAEKFFLTLTAAGVKRVVDIRLNNQSQLAGFAKKDDLIYFLKNLCQIDYIHVPDLAPEKALMDLVKRKKGTWAEYEAGYEALLARRNVDKAYLTRLLKDGDCLLCSEDKPDACHRRLVAQRFQAAETRVQVIHL